MYNKLYKTKTFKYYQQSSNLLAPATVKCRAGEVMMISFMNIWQQLFLHSFRRLWRLCKKGVVSRQSRSHVRGLCSHAASRPSKNNLDLPVFHFYYYFMFLYIIHGNGHDWTVFFKKINKVKNCFTFVQEAGGDMTADLS